MPDGTLDSQSEHGGCPVAEGHKWAANVWIWNRERPRFGSSGKQIPKNRRNKKGFFHWLFGSEGSNKEGIEGSTEIKIEFSNERSKEIEIFWLKTIDGAEQKFGSIGAQGKLPMNTFLGHTWVVRDAATHEKLKTVLIDKAHPLISIQ